MSAKSPQLAPPRQFHFSTDAFSPRERLSAWREIFGRTVVNLNIEPLDTESFFCEATVCQLPGMGLLRGKTAGVHLIHSRELIKDGDLSFMAAPTCHWTASQLGRDPVLEPGDGVLMNNAEVGSIRLSEQSCFTTFRVPLATIASLVPNLDDVIAKRIPAGNPALKLLVRYLDDVCDTGALAAAEVQQTAVAHVYDLLALVLGAARDAAEMAKNRGLRAARLHAIKGDITARIADEQFSVADIAKMHRVSPRYVQMLFETDGTTFSAYLLEQRCLRAYRMLTDGRYEGRSISAIAYESGFSNLSYFNRTFRRRFGGTPTDIRAEAKRGAKDAKEQG